MSATINFELREKKANGRGECPIFLRVTHNRKPAWMSTGLRVHPSKWNKEKQVIRRNHENHKKLNDQLLRVHSKAQDAILDLKRLGKLDSKRVINRVKGYESENFFNYAEKYIQNQFDQGSVRHAKNIRVIVNKVKDFQGNENLSINEIDRDFLNGLQAHLRNKYENANNTIRKNFQRLSRLLEIAKKEKYISANPFDDFELPPYQRTPNKSLSYDQIKAVENLELEEGTELWHVRNYFLFSFYNAGIRFGDLCKLKRKNVVSGRLKYLMSKTQNNAEPKWKNIGLLPPAVDILEKYDYREKKPEEYLFPIVDTSKNLEDPRVFDREKQSKNAIVNRHLKEIADLAEIEENLTTHMARHSFANYARKEGMSLYSISKALAHSDLKTTEQYLTSFDEEMLDSEMEELFS